MYEVHLANSHNLTFLECEIHKLLSRVIILEDEGLGLRGSLFADLAVGWQPSSHGVAGRRQDVGESIGNKSQALFHPIIIAMTVG